MKKAPMILVVLACISSLTACSGGSNNTPNSSSQETSSVLSSESSSKESSSSKTPSSSAPSSVIAQSSNVVASAGYKRVSLYARDHDSTSKDGYMISVEIPNEWVVSDDFGGFKTTSDPLVLGSFNFSLKNDQIYPDDYFETLPESPYTNPLSFKKLGGPPTNQYCFSLADGTPIYETSDGTAGTTYFDYHYVKSGQIIILNGIQPHSGAYGEEYSEMIYTDEELVHILSSLTLES